MFVSLNRVHVVLNNFIFNIKQNSEMSLKNLGAILISLTLLLSRATMVSVVHAAAEGCVDVHSMATGGHVDVCGLCCHPNHVEVYDLCCCWFYWARKLLKYSTSKLTISGRGRDVEGLSFIKGNGHWEFDHVPVCIRATQIVITIFFCSFFFLGGGGNSGRGWA